MALATRHENLFKILGRINRELLRLDEVQDANLVAGNNWGVDYLLNEYETQNRADLSANLYTRYMSLNSTLEGMEKTLITYATNAILDLAATLKCAKSIRTVLPLLYNDMLAPGGGSDAATVLKNTVAAGTATAGGSNVGNGKVVTSITNIDGITNEHIAADTVKVVCTADQYTNGTTNADRFSLNGSGTGSAYSYLKKKAPLSGQVILAEVDTILSNGSFEDFTVTNTPDNWTIDNGVVTTNLVEETSNVFLTGTSALFFKSNASAATIKIHQTIATVVSLGKKYAIQCQLRKVGTVTAGSTLQVSVKGTGFTTVNLFNADPNTLTTSYVAYSAVVDVNTILPSDLKVEVAWTSASGITAAEGILIDQITMAEMVEFNHVWYAIFRGSTDFQVDDYFTLANTNDGAGLFQTMFARYFDFVLPSVASSQTIDEAWATNAYTYP